MECSYLDEVPQTTPPNTLLLAPLKTLGESLKIPVHTIPHAKPDFKKWEPPSPFSVSAEPPPHHLVVTASFGRILPPSLLNMFTPIRRLNVHPSLLPAYRGPAPIQHAILNGDKETGVCVIKMLKWKEGIDAGDIWGSSRVPLYDGVMFTGLRDTLARAGGRLLVSVLREMRSGKATCTPQSHLGSLPHAPTISHDDSIIDFGTMTAEIIVRRFRAISHQRPLMTFLSTRKSVQLHSISSFHDTAAFRSRTPGTAAFHRPTRTLLVLCAQGSVISVPLMKQEGKSLMEAKDWWNGAKGLGLVQDGELEFVDGFSDNENVTNVVKAL